MTIEGLTFAAFQQGRERGREESAAEIDELKNRLSVLDEFRVASQNKLIAANEQHCEQLQAEIERLREALNDACDCFTTYSEHMPEYMHGESIKTHIKRYRAALQPKEPKAKSPLIMITVGNGVTVEHYEDGTSKTVQPEMVWVKHDT